MMADGNKDRMHGTARLTARRTALVSGVFCIVLATLVAANLFQLRTADPLDTPALRQVSARLSETPEDQTLRDAVRELDLLARKAYFTKRWQVRAGGWLLGAGLIVLIASLQVSAVIGRAPPQPSRCPGGETAWSVASKARVGLAWALAGAAVLALAVVMLSPTYLDSPVPPDSDQPGPAPAVDAAAEQPEPAVAARPLLPATRAAMLQEWPAFRGPEGNGVAHNPGTPPTTWDPATGDNIAWRSEVPLPGFGSPIVWGDRVFLSGANAQTREVYCFDGQDGSLLWRHGLAGLPGSPTESPTVTDDTGYAAPTMATDGVRVFAIFATGDIAALDFAGTRLWARNLGIPENHYGHSSSLIAHAGVVFVQYDHSGGCRLLALDSATGATAWEQKREVDISWSSPALVETPQGLELILNASPLVISYDPATGAERWRADCMSGEVAPAPAYGGGYVCVANQYATLAAIDINSGAVAWQTDEPDLPDVASPLATGDLLFLASSGGTVTGIDARDGRTLWSRDFDDGFYASPVLAGDRVYALDMAGTMHVFRAAEAFEPVGSAALAEPSFCTPAIVRARIYVRTAKHLYSIGK